MAAIVWVILFAVWWTGCGVLAYGFTIGYFAGKYPRGEPERGLARFVSIGGPVGLIVVWCNDGFRYGWRWE